MSFYSTRIGAIHESYIDDHSERACWSVIKDYFEFADIERAQEELWKLTAGLLSSDYQEGLESGERRQEIIYFYEFTKLLIEAVGDLYHDFHYKKEVKEE